MLLLGKHQRLGCEPRKPRDVSVARTHTLVCTGCARLPRQTELMQFRGMSVHPAAWEDFGEPFPEGVSVDGCCGYSPSISKPRGGDPAWGHLCRHSHPKTALLEGGLGHSDFWGADEASVGSPFQLSFGSPGVRSVPRSARKSRLCCAGGGTQGGRGASPCASPPPPLAM